MPRLPHQIPPPGLQSGGEAYDLPSEQPANGQVLTYSGTTGRLHWNYASGAGGGGQSVDIRDENIVVKTPTAFIDFTGPNVVALASGTGVRVEIGPDTDTHVEIRNENIVQDSNPDFIDFAGPGVTATASGTGVRVEVNATGGGGGGGDVAVEDEGTPVLSAASTLNFIGAGVDVSDAGGGQADITIAAPVAGVGFVFEFLDEIIVTGDTTSVSFGASGNGEYLKALNGDADEEYIIVGDWLQGVSSASRLTLRPNGISSNQTLSRETSSGGGMFNTTETELLLSQSPSTAVGTPHGFEAHLRARSGGYRPYRGETSWIQNSTTKEKHAYGGGWADNSTIVTSLDLVCDQASGIKAGSIFRLYRRTANPSVGSAVGSTYVKSASFAVNEGASTQEKTLGHPTYTGSIIGLTVNMTDARTAGTVTVNVKKNGTTQLSALIDGTNTVYATTTSGVGAHNIKQSDEITVEAIADSAYTNAASATTGLLVDVSFSESAGASVSTNVPYTDHNNLYTAGQTIAQHTLSDASEITVTGTISNNFELELTGTNGKLMDPKGVYPGTTLNFAVRQDGTGGHTLNFDTAYKFPGGAPTITATANAEDMISCYVRATTSGTAAGGTATVMLCSVAPDHT